MALKPSKHMDLLGSLCRMSLRPHWLQGLYMLHLHGGRLLKKPSATATYQAILEMDVCLWNVWNINYSTVFCPTPIMFFISYYLLKRTLATTCGNDLTPLLFPQKRIIWLERISCIGCYLRIFT